MTAWRRRERPLTAGKDRQHEERPVADLFNGVTGGNANSNLSLKNIFFQFISRFDSTAPQKIRQLNMPAVAQSAERVLCELISSLTANFF